MARVLNKTYFKRTTIEVARDLLGKSLCRRLASGKIVRGLINETEVYDGFEDRASHAFNGPTTRNVIMFGSPGRAYVYLCYGVHWMLNITTREKGYPAAVLIRGVGEINGPGRLTKHFQINSQFNGQAMTRVSGLWVEDIGVSPVSGSIVASERVGIDYAGEEWASKPLRFIWEEGSQKKESSRRIRH